MGLQRTYIILVLFICALLTCAGTASAGIVYSGGSGTADDPYLLSTDSDIDTLSATSVDWSKYFQLTQNITLVGNHTPIGKSTPYFSGNFDGNGYAVKNITVYQTVNYGGFFGYADSGANIFDLRVETSPYGVFSRSYAGVLIGQSYGSVSNCSTTGNVTVSNNYAGGLVGRNYGNVSNSYANTGNVTALQEVAGCLLGMNWGNISNCYATGDATSRYLAGGLIGYNFGSSANINNCFATGTASVTGSYVGGLIGLNDGGAVTNCYYSGSPADSYSTSSSYSNFTSFAFVSGASGLNWNGSSNIITTEENSDLIWRIDDGSGLPYIQDHSSIPGTLPVNSSVTGAWVYVNGTNQSAQTNTTLTLIPGWYNITVIKQYYETPGNQTVNVTEGTNSGINFTLTPLSAVANFTSNVTSGAIPLSVAFTDRSACVVDSWLWDFGDGNTSTDQNPTHSYASVGSYNVSLNVTNSVGSNVSTQLSYITTAAIPVTNFTSDVTSGTAPLTVSFTDASANTPTSWLWNFGDGSNSTDQNPAHSYTTAGTYNVTLNATNSLGSNISTQAGYITVNVVSSTSSSSSSSGTRASVSQGQDPGIVERSASSVIRITSGADVNYDFSDSGSPVIGVSFEAQDDKGLVVAKVQVLSEAPDGVPASQGRSYQMMSIDVGSEGTISTDNAGNIRIQFKVSKQWIEENNIDVSTIRMTRYRGDQWNDLPSYQAGEDDEYFYFYAETPGFSVFDVVGDEIGEVSEQAHEQVSETIVEEEAEPVEEEETKDTPGFTALAGIAVVSLVVLAGRKQN